MSHTGITVGIDIATAHVRVVALDGETPGRLIGPVELPLPTPIKDSAGWVSQDSAYATTTRQVLASLTALLGPVDTQRIRALSITATSGTLVPTDSQGGVVCDALMYNDTRGDAFVAEVAAEFLPDRPHASLGRLWWLAHNTAADLVLSPTDVVARDMTNGVVVATDNSHHLKTGIDPVGLTWPEGACEALGIPATVLPDLGPSGVVVGVVDDGYATAVGLPTGVTIVSGMTDGCTSQIATGGIGVGDSVGVLGTTFVLKATSATPVTDITKGVYSHLSPDGVFLPGGASNVGLGSMPSELLVGPKQTLHDTIEKAGQAGLSSTAHYPLPGTGERFPFSVRSARATLASAPTSLLDHVRSVMEGVAFVERLGLEVLESYGALLTRHHVSGGGSKSMVWNEVRASVLNRTLTIPRYSDSAVGAALIAAQALSSTTLAETTQALLPPAHQVDPRAEWRTPLEDRWGEFLDMLENAGYIEPRKPGSS